jgi:hypothetical protein
MHLYETYIDPNFKYSASIAQYCGELARRYADYALLPLNVKDLSSYIVDNFQGFERSYGELLKGNGCQKGLEYFRKAVNGFARAADGFQDRLDKADKSNVLLMRQINDQLMSLERSFLDHAGLPDRPLVKNVLYAPSSFNSYSATTFAGVVDSLFEIEQLTEPTERQKRWEQVKKQLSIVTFGIDSAGNALSDPTRFSS